MTAKESSEEYNRPNQIILPTIYQRIDRDSPTTITDVTNTKPNIDTKLIPNNLPTCEDLNFLTGMSIRLGRK